MNRILAVFVFLIFASSITAIAEEQAKPPQQSLQSSAASQPQGDKKASENPPKEEINIIDFCRTHTC